MIKRIIIASILLFATLGTQANIDTIKVWDGYFQFLPSTLTVQLGDTIVWLPLDQPTVMHTITSGTIPTGALAFDQAWQMPTDTFFSTFLPWREYTTTPAHHILHQHLPSIWLVHLPWLELLLLI